MSSNFLAETASSATRKLKKPSPQPPSDATSGKKGIMVFDLQFSDASGHATLWNGTNAIDEDFFHPRAGLTLQAVKLWHLRGACLAAAILVAAAQESPVKPPAYVESGTRAGEIGNLRVEVADLRQVGDAIEARVSQKLTGDALRASPSLMTQNLASPKTVNGARRFGSFAAKKATLPSR